VLEAEITALLDPEHGVWLLELPA